MRRGKTRTLEGNMSGRTRISLAMIRNNLYNGRFAEPDRQTLDEVTATVQGSQSPFRELMLEVIANARADIQAKRLKEAGYELNAIHNLPVERADFGNWDKDWFFTAEVPSYIERVGQGARAERFLKLVTEAKTRHDTVAL
jgi:hypothetical protein